MLLYLYIILLSLELGIFGGLITPVCSYILSESRLCHSTHVCLCRVLHNGWICSQGSHKIRDSACSTLAVPATALSIPQILAHRSCTSCTLSMTGYTMPWLQIGSPMDLEGISGIIPEVLISTAQGLT